MFSKIGRVLFAAAGESGHSPSEQHQRRQTARHRPFNWGVVNGSNGRKAEVRSSSSV